MIVVYKVSQRTKQIHPLQADLWTGKDVIDADEQEWLAKEAADKAAGKQGSWVYRHTLGYLF